MQQCRGTLHAAIHPNMQEMTMSYAELDAHANQLAHRLIELGVRPEVPVGVLLPRSLDLVVALLGVLKAGGAYVPMDPAYPADRLAMILEDSEARPRISGMNDAPSRMAQRSAWLLGAQAPVLLSRREVFGGRNIGREVQVLLVRPPARSVCDVAGCTLAVAKAVAGGCAG